MKVRNGFVSNSSSSSFIVIFPSLPGSVEELQQMLFGDDERYPNPYCWDNRMESWSTRQVAETVWRDLQEKGAITLAEAEEIGISGSVEGSLYPDYPHYTGNAEDDGKRWEEFYERRQQADLTTVREFLKNAPTGPLVAFTYSDNDGDYFCALEHGSLFDRLPHMRVSHH